MEENPPPNPFIQMPNKFHAPTRYAALSDMYNNNNIAHSYLEERAYPFWGPRNI